MLDNLRTAAPSVLLLLGLVACQELPTQRGLQVTGSATPELATVHPNDVVVAPVEYTEEGVSAPDRELRQALSVALVERHYAPLNLDFVDATLVPSTSGTAEASYRAGSLGEEAVLRIVVHSWDEHLWSVRRALLLNFELQLVRPDRGSEVLWSAHVDQRFDFQHLDHKHVTEIGLRRAALQEVAREALGRLPERVARPGNE